LSYDSLTYHIEAIFGPAATTWYGFLQRHVTFRSPRATLVARVAADQVLFTPVHLCAFLSSMSILEGTDPVEKLRSSLLPSYRANLALWPAVQFVNFSLVPLEYRVLVVNLVSLGEEPLSFLASRKIRLGSANTKINTKAGTAS
jgi:protein Mpv17